MEKLFGIPMPGLAAGLFAVVLVTGGVATLLAWRNRLVFKLAVRNIPRRRAQSVLIIFGLTLSTTIISAALAIGDTVSNSIRGAAIEGLGGSDVRVSSPREALFGDRYMPEARAADVRAALAGDARVDGVMPQVRESLPVTLARTGKTEAATRVIGLDISALDGFQGVTATDGTVVDLSRLRPDGAVINADLAGKLDAQAGDRIEAVTPAGRAQFTVAAVAKRGGLAGSDPRVLVTLPAAQAAVGKPGQITNIEVSAVGAPGETAHLSEQIAKDLRLKFTNADAARQLFDAMRDPAALAEIERQAGPASNLPGGLRRDLGSLAADLKKPAATDEFRELMAKPAVAGAVFAAMETAGRRDLMLGLVPAYARLQELSVEEVKHNFIELANLVGSFITTIFTVLGSFSIIVGLLLIFLVFVLLAASRTAEMGIARAVGMKRGQLVQMFSFEGLIYAGVAALIGVALGVITSLGVVEIFVRAVQPGDDGFSIRYSVAFTSLVAGFSLGLLLTAVTVGISAYRVSRLNIVVAIRGIAQEFARPEQASVGGTLKDVGLAVIAPVRHLARLVSPRGGTRRSASLRSLLTSLLLVPWAWRVSRPVFRFIMPGARQGWPQVAAGLFSAQAGIRLEQAAPFTIGVSLLLVGLGLMLRAVLRRTRMRGETEDRVAYTFMGATLLVFWSLPFDTLEPLTGKLNANIEMFVLSGVWMVAAATWLVIHNADVLLWAMDRTLGHLGKMRPVIKMAVAYPVNARFRTGLTVAMFALVIFTLMVFAILNGLGNVSGDEPDRVTGGYDLRATVNEDLPVTDMAQAIAGSPLLDAGDFDVIAAQADVAVEARQTGATENRFRALRLRIGDGPFLRSNQLRVSHYDPKYGTTSREIWDALAQDPSLAAVSAGVISQQQGFGNFGAGFKAEGVEAGQRGPMTAFQVEMRPPLRQSGEGRTVTRTVIAVVDQFAESIERLGEGPGGGGPGGALLLYTGPAARTALGPGAVPYTVYKFRLKDPSKAKDLAPVLETVFIEHGMEASSTAEDIEDMQSQSAAFNRMFQGFMGLGLVVGVAALGVISFRAVVERRQSIGMLRALGFRAGMIRTLFLVESSFVALLGTAMGLGLGTLISWSIVEDLSDEVEGLKFTIPWLQVALIVTVALVFSLLMSWAPARQASKIYPSEALRYE